MRGTMSKDGVRRATVRISFRVDRQLAYQGVLRQVSLYARDLPETRTAAERMVRASMEEVGAGLVWYGEKEEEFDEEQAAAVRARVDLLFSDLDYDR